MRQETVDTIKGDGFVAEIYCDECPENPREEWDNVGKLYCKGHSGWSSRDYSDTRLIQPFKSPVGESLIVGGDGKLKPAQSPRRVSIASSPEDAAQTAWEECRGGGIAFSVADSGGQDWWFGLESESPLVFDYLNEWDDRDATERIKGIEASEFRGVWWISAKDIVKECPKKSRRAQVEWALRMAKWELDTFNQWTAGEVYGVCIKALTEDGEGEEEIGEEVDSCWGFYGIDYARGEAARMLKDCEDSTREDREKLALMESTEGAGI